MLFMFKLLLLGSFLLLSLETSASSDFRIKKYLYSFNQYFDINRDGVIDKREIDTFILNIGNLRSWDTCDERFKEVQEKWLKFWEQMVHHFKHSEDVVTIKDWVESWQEYAKNPKASLKWQKYFEQICFEYLDEDCDGYISEDEFIQPLVYFGAQPKEVAIAFGVVSRGRTGISRDQYHELWKQYYASEDIYAPGNWFLGNMALN